VAVFSSHSHQRLWPPRNRCVRQPPVRCPCAHVPMSFALYQSRTTALPSVPRRHDPPMRRIPSTASVDRPNTPSSRHLFPTAATNVTLCPPSRSNQRADRHHGLPPIRKPTPSLPKHLILAASPDCICRSTISSSSSLSASSPRPVLPLSLPLAREIRRHPPPGHLLRIYTEFEHFWADATASTHSKCPATGTTTSW
jgi:hypothetical protein